jgi:YhcH/YjgK/YiaL family protein
MIIDRLQNVLSGLYPTLFSAADKSGLAQRLASGFEYLQSTDLASLEPGRVEIDGDQVFALVQEYTSKPMEQGRWEAHRKFIDIQYIVSGEENIGYANVADLTLGEYNEEKDRYIPQGEGSFVRLSAGMFGVYMPEDAHMPNMAVDQPQPVKKVVVKVAV